MVKKFDKMRFHEVVLLDSTGWTAQIQEIVESLVSPHFTLDDIYEFEGALEILHPDNKHIREKIRQQLQILRDNNVIEFNGDGEYTRL